MNATRLLEHYEHIADAPAAIARLRRFILDLAVRGKLVPQASNDEPATALLKRIAADKARLVSAGRPKKVKSSADHSAATANLLIPSGWAVTDLLSICVSITD